MRKPNTKATRGSDAEMLCQPKPYEPTQQERAAIERHLARKRNAPPPPRFKVIHKSNVAMLEPDHPDFACATALLAESMGTGDITLAVALVDQLALVSRKGETLTANELNSALATIHGIAPRDPIEALLAAQMAAIHQATMVAARRLNHTETIDQQDSASNMFNKLARTFASQVEALKKYRSSGEQKVTVQHVNVTAGQAIVGVRQGGGGPHENANQSHAPGAHAATDRADAGGPALLGQEQAVRAPMPFASRERSKNLSHARGEGGRTDG